MKKWREDSDDASALRVTLAVALLFVVAVLFAFPFAAGPASATSERDFSRGINPLTPPPPFCTDNTWHDTSLTNAPPARSGHTAVWTGSEMIVWGGNVGSGYTSSGGRYNPVTNSWTPLNTLNAPNPRTNHTAVWTGSEMIIWGGQSGSNTGGRYNPVTNSWTPLNTLNAPSPRFNHTAVWTGTEMIVWGGALGSADLNSGGRYNPITDTWTTTNALNAPVARSGHTAVWTGSQMIVWGGNSKGNSGGRYDPITNSWLPTNTVNVPTHGIGHTAVWTGSEMIIWGGSAGSKIGGRYNPVTDTWLLTSAVNAPTDRYLHTAIWDGEEMIVWGGGFSNIFETGGRYNPANDSWTSTATTGAPVGRIYHRAIWTGSEMIIWGGAEDIDASPTPTSAPNPGPDQPSGVTLSNSGGRYCAQESVTPTPTGTPTATPTPPPPGPTVSLPIDTISNQVPTDTVLLKPIATTNINPNLQYIGFQGDFTFDEGVITFSPPFVEPAGLTSSNWNVSGNILPGTGPVRIFRVSAFSKDSTPLSGSGTLYNLRMLRVSNEPQRSTPLYWRPFPDNFYFADKQLNKNPVTQVDGFITITGTGPTATPTPFSPTATPSPTPSPTHTPQPTPVASATPVNCDGGFSYFQGFDDITTLIPSGWIMQNNSQPGPGTTDWFQGNSSIFPGLQGGATSYIGANFNNGTGTSTISNWLLTPPLFLRNGATLRFYTRTVDTPAFPDRLQVRMSTNGYSTNVGATATSTGDFNELLLDINPTYTTTGYPTSWTQFTVILNGIPSPTLGRLAFRYFVENGGPSGSNSDYIGIDTLSMDAICVCDTTSFTNAAPITIPASGSSGVSAPYPSSITVSGMENTISRVSVALHGLTHAHPKDIDMLLVGPNGQNAIIMSDAGGYAPIAGTNIILADGGRLLPNGGPFVSKEYAPTNIADCDEDATDAFPAPAPTPSGNSSFAVFNGTDPNGTWSLYAVDDKGGNVGNLTDGWALTITTGACLPTPTSTPPTVPTPTRLVLSVPTTVVANAPFAFSVTVLSQFGQPIAYSGFIHFTSSDPSAVLPPDSTLGGSSGTFNATLVEPSSVHTITATAVGNVFLTGTSNCISVLEPGTPTPTPTPTPVPCGAFSNSATITIPSSGGSSSPYPSDIEVSGVGGAITKVTVAINGINHTYPRDIDALLIGPEGQYTFVMSDVGGGTAVTGVNLVLDDSAPNPLPDSGLFASGTYRPTNIDEHSCDFGGNAIDPFPSPVPFLTLTGSALAVFNGTNPNGTWSLYVVDDSGSGQTGSFSGGWAIAILTDDCAGPTVTPAPTPTPGATHFVVSAPDFVYMENHFDFTVTALDRFNYIVTDYPGLVHFTSSDPFFASLPPDGTLTNGTGTFSAQLNAFMFTVAITASDTSDNSVTGTSNCISVGKHPPPTPVPTHALNLSTRLLVGTGNDAGIAGLIITGNSPRQVLFRGIGPSLGKIGVMHPLVDPVLELHGAGGFVTITNHNWRDSQELKIIATGLPPTDDLESAILATLDPGTYTAILRGDNNGTGTGLVEIYDLSHGDDSKLSNISTRGFVSTGSDIVIAGFILDGGTYDRILVRGIGPSLTASGVPNALANPTLELRNGDGALVAANDDWQNGPPVSLPPTDSLESAIEATLSPGAFTALLFGVNNGTGVGLVEVYDLGAP